MNKQDYGMALLTGIAIGAFIQGNSTSVIVAFTGVVVIYALKT